MELRPLGTTGLDVAPIGFGAFKIGRNQKTKYAVDYDLPTDREVESLLGGPDAGINLIDTAPATASERRIGDSRQAVDAGKSCSAARWVNASRTGVRPTPSTGNP